MGFGNPDDGNRFRHNLLEGLNDTSDAFGTLIADGTTNRGDLGSHFPYSPEAYRLYQDGTRVDLQYDQTFLDTRETDVFRDERDAYVLKPDVGETLAYQTAERFRYVVAYESAFSMAWGTSRPLGTDETVRILFDGSLRGEPIGIDGHGIEYDADGATQFITRDGTRVAETAVSDPRPETEWTIYENTFNWYNVGQKQGTEFYANGVEQQTSDFGTVATDGERGPRTGNGRVTVEIERGAGAPMEALEVTVGSFGYKNLGQVSPKTRSKTFPMEVTLDGDVGYEPVAALRVGDERDLVTTDIANILPIVTQGDTNFLVTANAPDLTDATNFSEPPETDGISSAVEVTTDITEAPDASGTPQTNTETPGGYQIAFSNSETSGQGSSTRTATTTRERRRRLHDTDHATVWMDGQSGTVEFLVATEQEW